VQQGHGPVELLLCLWRARHREVYGAKLFGSPALIMGDRISSDEHGEKEDNENDDSRCHGTPPAGFLIFA
jgi:hypothetical protein